MGLPDFVRTADFDCAYPSVTTKMEDAEALLIQAETLGDRLYIISRMENADGAERVPQLAKLMRAVTAALVEWEQTL